MSQAQPLSLLGSGGCTVVVGGGGVHGRSLSLVVHCPWAGQGWAKAVFAGLCPGMQGRVGQGQGRPWPLTKKEKKKKEKKTSIK